MQTTPGPLPASRKNGSVIFAARGMMLVTRFCMARLPFRVRRRGKTEAICRRHKVSQNRAAAAPVDGPTAARTGRRARSGPERRDASSQSLVRPAAQFVFMGIDINMRFGVKTLEHEIGRRKSDAHLHDAGSCRV